MWMASDRVLQQEGASGANQQMEGGSEYGTLARGVGAEIARWRDSATSVIPKDI